MKKIYFLALMILPVLGFSQDFSFDLHGDTILSVGLGKDVENELDVVNETSSIQNLRWRLMPDFSQVPSWTDYVCEGVLVCWPTEKRFNDFQIMPNEAYQIFFHVNTASENGIGIGRFCVYDMTDSANTIQCASYTIDASLPDTVSGYVNGVPVIVVGTDTFETVGGQYVPLGLEEESSAFQYVSTLSQNSPNPSKGFSVINYELVSGNGSMTFHDLTGKLVKELKLNDRKGQVTMNGDLDAGIYFYSLWENGTKIDSKRMQVID